MLAHNKKSMVLKDVGVKDAKFKALLHLGRNLVIISAWNVAEIKNLV